MSLFKAVHYEMLVTRHCILWEITVCMIAEFTGHEFDIFQCMPTFVVICVHECYATGTELANGMDLTLILLTSPICRIIKVCIPYITLYYVGRAVLFIIFYFCFKQICWYLIFESVRISLRYKNKLVIPILSISKLIIKNTVNYLSTQMDSECLLQIGRLLYTF